jgi:hypothetical protein
MEFDLGISVLDQAGLLRGDVFDLVPEAELFNWCDQQPWIRYPAVAGGVTAFRRSGESGRQEWTEIGRKLWDEPL